MPLGQGSEGRGADSGALRRTGRAGPGAFGRRSGHLPQRGGDPDRSPAAPPRRDRAAGSAARTAALRSRRATASPARPASPIPTSSPRSSSTCARRAGTPKARLAYLFPNGRSAQIIVRLRPDLSEAERHRAIETIEASSTIRSPARPASSRASRSAASSCTAASYVISGVPVVVDAVTRALKDALLVLLGVALVVMALDADCSSSAPAGGCCRSAVALAAAALTFGLFGLVGGSLTMASIAVLPILIGLAVDYAIQLQARYDEAIAIGASPGRDAARLAASRGGPTIATACLATGAGFLALQLSPTPMVRGFGLLLVVGIAIAFALAFVAGFAALSLRAEGGSVGSPRRRAASWVFRLASLAAVEARCRRKTGRRGRHSRGTRHSRRAAACSRAGSDAPTAGSRRWPGAGRHWLGPGNPDRNADGHSRSWRRRMCEAVRELNELQDATGVSGELDVRVTAPDLTDPATIRWMAASSGGCCGRVASLVRTRAARRLKSARARRCRTSSPGAGSRPARRGR